MRRKNGTPLPAVLVAVIVFALHFTAPAAAAAERIDLYTIYGWGTYADSQYLQAFNGIMSAALNNIGVHGDFKHFDDEKEFFRTIKAPGENIIQVGNREQLSAAMTAYGYRPFLSYEFLNLKKNRNCLYVRKDSRVKAVGDLKGRSLTMSANMMEYASLRRMLCEKPEKYFKGIDFVGDGDAPAYSFYMDNPDAMWITVQQTRFLQISNPEIVKNVRRVVCSEEHAHMALLASPGVSKDVTDRIFTAVDKIMKTDESVKYFPLAKFMKVRMVRVASEDYAATLELYRKAVSSGWDADYRKLTANRKNEKK